MNQRKLQAAALVLPLLGAFLLLSPLIGALDPTTTLAGIPAPVFYVFCLWTALIAAAARLARALRLAERSDETAPDTPERKA